MVSYELTGFIKLTCSQDAMYYFTVPSLFQFHAECELGAELVMPSGMFYSTVLQLLYKMLYT
jgi:hypothetical protein